MPPGIMWGMTTQTQDQKDRAGLVETLLRFNPWGGYCAKPCKHPGHSTEAYRKTVARLEGSHETVGHVPYERLAEYDARRPRRTP